MKAGNIKTVAVISCRCHGTADRDEHSTQRTGERLQKVILCDSFSSNRKQQNGQRIILPDVCRKGRLTRKEANKGSTKVLLLTAMWMRQQREADLVIEAIIEDLKTKRELFARISKIICKPDAILSTNKPNIVSSKLADVTEHSERLLNIHYFNPALVMKLVEIVKRSAYYI